MRDSFEIAAASGNYSVVSGTGLLGDVVADNRSAIFLIDARLQQHLLVGVRKIEIEATEYNKSLEYIPEVIRRLRILGADRTSILIAVGGGTIQDIATFSASIYMRGIEWAYMPTTFLGMTDSCIGGKSSINVLGYKNLVGNFHPPARVLIDLNFLASLNAEQMVAGLYEAVKICYARGHEAFQDYLSDAPSVPISLPIAQRTIIRSLKAKKWFIETDEFDRGERLLLNFGHTFGHAIEAGTEFEVSHGIAVGIGMLVAIEYANRRSWLSQSGLNRTMQLQRYIRSLLGEADSRVTKAPSPIRLELLMEKFDNDKKHRSDAYCMVVPKEDGCLELISEPRSELVRRGVVAAYRDIFGEIGWDVRASN